MDKVISSFAYHINQVATPRVVVTTVAILYKKVQWETIYNIEEQLGQLTMLPKRIFRDEVTSR